MRIFNWYIAKNLLFTLALSLGILAFVMMSAHLFRLFALLASGVSPATLGQMLLLMLPDCLRYAMPLSMLVATVLVYSRMSADNEMVALQASGVSVWQAISPALLLAIILCGIGVWLGLYFSPEMRYQSARLQWAALSENPLSMLDPGVTLRLTPTSSLRVGRIDESGLLHDVHFYELDSEGNELRDLTAARGMVHKNVADNTIELVLEDFTITERAVSAAAMARRREEQQPDFLAAKSIAIPISYEKMQSRKLTRKAKMMPVGMLLGSISLEEASGRRPLKQWLDLQQRLSLAFSPLAFLLLGIPFGLRNRRSETSAGLIICVILGLVYYAFMLLSDALLDYPALHPELIIWIPNLLYQGIGLYALCRRR